MMPDRRRCVVLAVLLRGAAAFAQPDAPPAGAAHPPSAPGLEQSGRLPRTPGYVGLRLRQNPEGVVVAGVQPGPLGGDGFKSASIWRGDLIVSIDGQSLEVVGYVRLIQSLVAGSRVQVVYRRSAQADPYAAIPRGDPDGEERSVEIVLDDAQKWSVPIGRGLAFGRKVPPAQPGEFEGLVLAMAEELGLRSTQGGLDALTAHLAQVQQRLLAPDTLPSIVRALQRPASLDHVEAEIAAQVRPLAQTQPLADTLDALHRLILRVLDLPDVRGQPGLLEALARARQEYGARARSLMRFMRDDSAALGPDLAAHLELMRASRDFAPLAVAMLPAVAQCAVELEQLAREAAASPQPIPPELAARVDAAVQGPVLAARVVDGELWVVGGDQPNRYDMDLLGAVFDIGGADRYHYSTANERNYQLVIDAAGDDVYESDVDFAGPGSATFSVSIVQDRAGDDRYVALGQGSIGAGLFGVGMVIDEAGDDRYVNGTPQAGWAEGVAMYGAGVLVDRGGDDLYVAQVLAQGAGGPGGLGLLLDASGADSYVANGAHFRSAYGTPDVFAGFAQGFGTGMRDMAAGGMGVLYDLGGDDFYSVGEFGQGTGYFQGLGILHDSAGDDRYVGSRYVQGSAAHQAAGILIDDGGHDSYACAGPAGQGAAWDESVGMLIDRSGDDVYSANDVGQGSAAHQALAILVDLGGADAYACSGACQGHSAGNGYHYDAARAFSFSAFIHQGRPGSASGRLQSTGRVQADAPGESRCCGLYSGD
jgi:hypothetical protein